MGNGNHVPDRNRQQRRSHLLIVGYYIGKYKGDLEEANKKIEELEAEGKQERRDSVGIRERLRYLEAKINGVGWKREG